MNPLQELMKGLSNVAKQSEIFNKEKRIEIVAERLLTALTESVGLAYTTDEKRVKSAVSMCFVVAEEFVEQAYSRQVAAQEANEAAMKRIMEAEQAAINAAVAGSTSDGAKQDEPTGT